MGGLRTKLKSLKLAVNTTNDYDAIVLVETSLHENIYSSELEFIITLFLDAIAVQKVLRIKIREGGF